MLKHRIKDRPYYYVVNTEETRIILVNICIVQKYSIVFTC